MSPSTPPRLTPPPGTDLETATDVVLAEVQPLLEGPALPRCEGPPAVRATLAARVQRCRLAQDRAGERSYALTLAGLLLDGPMDLDDAVRLLERALALGDDAVLREQLAGRLASLGRWADAADLLWGVAPEDEQAHAETLMAAGLLYARAGEQRAARSSFEQAAELAPNDPRPPEQLAALEHWAPGGTPAERTADAWLRAAAIPACRALLEQAIESEDPATIGAAADAVLSLARPLGELGPVLVRALQALLELDGQSGKRLVGGLLSAASPGDEVVLESLEALARQSGDHELGRAVLWRRAGAETLAPVERGKLDLRLAELCLEIGDLACAAEHLRCAASRATELDAVLDGVERATASLEAAAGAERSDGLIALTHAKALATTRAHAAEQRDGSAAALAWRQLAALRWDLAEDELGAEEALLMACRQEPERGPYRYAADLCERAGVGKALDALEARAAELSGEDDRALRARLLTAAAHLGRAHGQVERALGLAQAAVRRDPTRSDAVALVEKLARGEEGITVLTDTYALLARAAAGRFGRRAAHYRAARHLEQRGAHAAAFRQAVAAFEAVPGEGAVYALLERLAERIGERETLVRTIATVLDACPEPARVGWLERAARLAEGLEGQAELRLELWLQLLRLGPNAAVVEQMASAIEALRAEGHGDELARRGLAETAAAVLPELWGPHGAATAIALGELGLSRWQDTALGTATLLRAIEMDREGADYSPVLRWARVIADDRDRASSLLDQLAATAHAPMGSLAPSLRQLARALAAQLGHPSAERWADETLDQSSDQMGLGDELGTLDDEDDAL